VSGGAGRTKLGAFGRRAKRMSNASWTDVICFCWRAWRNPIHSRRVAFATLAAGPRWICACAYVWVEISSARIGVSGARRRRRHAR
jgi:hypothetical protein